MTVQTVEGGIGRAKKKGGFFRKIGEAFKKGASFLWKGAAKINPILVPARAAFLTMVKNNTGGIAKQMQRKGADKARKKWEALGGDWGHLKKAIEHGAKAPIKGIGAMDIDPQLTALLLEVNKAAGVQGIGAIPAFAAILQAAKPIIEPILKILGIKLGEKEPEGGGAPVPDPAGEQLAKELNNLPPSPVTDQVQRAVQDPGLPNPGGGGGSDGGGGFMSQPWVPFAIGGGVLLLLMNNRRR